MKKHRGEMALDGAAALLALVAMLVLAISVFGVINQIAIVNEMADDMARFIEQRGEYGADAEAEFTRLANATGMKAHLSFSGDLMTSAKLQLGTPFEVKVKATGYIGIGNLFKLPITLSGTSQGRGEKLWK